MPNNIIEEDLLTKISSDNRDRNLYDILVLRTLQGPNISIKSRVDGITPYKFNHKKGDLPPLSLSDIDGILTGLTYTVMISLFNEVLGGYSLKNTLDNAHRSSKHDQIAFGNIAYGVLSVVSASVLGMLLLYIEKNYIFIYIRDSIVQPAFRTNMEKLNNMYSNNTVSNINIELLNQYGVKANSFISTLLVDAGGSNHSVLIRKLEELADIRSKGIESHSIETLLTTTCRFPLPKKLLNMLTSGDKSTPSSITPTDNVSLIPDIPGVTTLDISLNGGISINEFLVRLKTIFSLDGLMELYKAIDIELTHGMSFKITLQCLHSARLEYNSIKYQVDGLTIHQHKVLNKILSFDRLTEEDSLIVKDSEVLSNIVLCCGRVSSEYIANIDNSVITFSKAGKVEYVFHYKNKDLGVLTSVFGSIFTSNTEVLQNVYNLEPHRFCLNQAVYTKKETSSLLMHKKQLISDTDAAFAHNDGVYNRLARKYANNDEVKTTINKYSSPNTTPVLRYLKPSSFSAIIVETEIIQLYTIAEIKGIKKWLDTISISNKPLSELEK